jgi:hypothetical protein
MHGQVVLVLVLVSVDTRLKRAVLRNAVPFVKVRVLQMLRWRLGPSIVAVLVAN